MFLNNDDDDDDDQHDGHDAGTGECSIPNKDYISVIWMIRTTCSCLYSSLTVSAAALAANRKPKCILIKIYDVLKLIRFSNVRYIVWPYG